ncbi:MAG TPA: hypothetical protein VGD78_11530 [Chthoniobacterales bacterium]
MTFTTSYSPLDLAQLPYPCRMILKLHGLSIGSGMALRIFLNHPDPKADTPHDHPGHVRTISSTCCAMRQMAVRFEVDVTDYFLASKDSDFHRFNVLRLDLIDAAFHDEVALTPAQVESVEFSVEVVP